MLDPKTWLFALFSAVDNIPNSLTNQRQIIVSSFGFSNLQTTLLGCVDGFIEIVTRVVELARGGHVAEARELQLSQAGPLADRLERLTNQLVNLAEADMVAGIEASQRVYGTSRTIVVAFAVGSIVLALGLGYAISRSLVGPVTEIEARLHQTEALIGILLASKDSRAKTVLEDISEVSCVFSLYSQFYVR